MTSAQDQQNIAIVSSLGEIKGTLNTFMSRFTQHEAQDIQTAKGFDDRMERAERRSDTRGMEFFKAIEDRFVQLGDRMSVQVDKLDKRMSDQIRELDQKVASVDAKVEAVTLKQTFSSGGWRYLSIAGGVILSFLMSAASLTIELLSRVHS